MTIQTAVLIETLTALGAEVCYIPRGVIFLLLWCLVLFEHLGGEEHSEKLISMTSFSYR